MTVVIWFVGVSNLLEIKCLLMTGVLMLLGSDVTDINLCPYATLWKHWNLSGYKPIKKLII